MISNNPLKDKFIIVDNFYQDPNQVRNYALMQQYDEPKNSNYPGVMSKSSFFTDDHYQVFREITNEDIEQQGGSSLCGKFRLTKQTDSFTQYIHFDPGDAQVWSGVAYLSLPEHYTNSNGTVINAGTSFWKHKETGLEAIPHSKEEISRYGWNSVEDLKHFLETEGINETKWEKTFTVPIKYNRLVLFRPWLFHSSGIQFGNSFNNSRLIQVFFLRLKQI